MAKSKVGISWDRLIAVAGVLVSLIAILISVHATNLANNVQESIANKERQSSFQQKKRDDLISLRDIVESEYRLILEASVDLTNDGIIDPQKKSRALQAIGKIKQAYDKQSHIFAVENRKSLDVLSRQINDMARRMVDESAGKGPDVRIKVTKSESALMYQFIEELRDALEIELQRVYDFSAQHN